MELTQQRLDEIFTAHQNGNFELLLKLAKKLQQDFPQFVLGYKAAGVALLSLDRKKEAITEMKQAVKLDPNDDEALVNLGTTLLELAETNGDNFLYEEAKNIFERAFKVNPKSNLIKNNLVQIYVKKAHNLADNKKMIQALNLFEEAQKIDPNNLEVLNGLIRCFGSIGESDKAEEVLSLYHKINPNNLEFYEVRLTNSFYMTSASANLIKQKSTELSNFIQQKNKQWYPNFKGFKFNKFKINQNDKKRLKIGFVSGNFYEHAVTKFLYNLIYQLIVGKAKFDFYAYSTSNKTDKMTAKLRPLFTKWRNITNVDDLSAAKKIYEDGVQILFDLSGRTIGNRLRMFSLKPAPIQISWIGWLGTTGIPTMDYFLADESCVPSGEKYEQQFSEKVLRMPDIWEVLAPPDSENLPPPPPHKK